MNTSPVLRWALVLGLVVILNLFFNFAVKTVYKEPLFEKFCVQKQVTVVPGNQSECVKQGGSWTEDPARVKTNFSSPEQIASVSTATAGYCDVNFTCQKEYQTARDLYERNVFVILVILGVISLGIAYFVTAQSVSVSYGLALGGFVSFVIASVRYWSAMDDYLRVVILGLALVALIWMGIKKFKD